jgi:hypothetical protein
MKGQALLNILIEYYCRIANDPTLGLKQMLLQEPVDCFAGFDGSNIIWTQFVLGHTISEDGVLLEHPINDYCRHVVHTEEHKQLPFHLHISYMTLMQLRRRPLRRTLIMW